MKTGLAVTTCEGQALHHVVPRLGNGVAEQIVALVGLYANRASLRDIPPITLQGTRWAQPWEELATVTGVSGNSGSSNEQVRAGVPSYTCFVLSLPDPAIPLDGLPHPGSIEGVTAHEICHLRWPKLEHGPEFAARVLALLQGATFPPRGGWSQRTRVILSHTRQEAGGWYRRLLERSRQSNRTP